MRGGGTIEIVVLNQSPYAPGASASLGWLTSSAFLEVSEGTWVLCPFNRIGMFDHNSILRNTIMNITTVTQLATVQLGASLGAHQRQELDSHINFLRRYLSFPAVQRFLLLPEPLSPHAEPSVKSHFLKTGLHQSRRRK